MRIGIDIDGVLTDIEQWQLDYGSKVIFENINIISKKIPVICFDAKYNQQCKGRNIIRCYSWYDIYAKIQELIRGEK